MPLWKSIGKAALLSCIASIQALTCCFENVEIVINLGIGQAGAKMVPFSQPSGEANSLKFVNVGKKLDIKF